MSENGVVRRGTGQPAKARITADPSGAVDPEEEEEQWERVEPLASAAAPSPGEEGAAVATAAPPASPALPREIQAKGPHGEDMTLVQDEEGNWVVKATNAPPPPVSAPVDHPLLGSLRARTRKVKGQVQRAPAYNHKMMWFMKPDGDIVKLQGDPGNRAYYEDKGYVPLNPEEVRAWERSKTRVRFDPETGERITEVIAPSIRKRVIALQRERAQLIEMIRSIAARHAAVEVTGDLSITPTEELQAMVQKLQRIDGPNFTLLSARQPVLEREWDDEDDNLDNLEVGSGADLERKVDAFNRMGRSREQMVIGGRQRSNSSTLADLSGNADNS